VKAPGRTASGGDDGDGDARLAEPALLPPLEPDAAGVVSWVHLGDLHTQRPDDEVVRRVRALVGELDAAFAGKASFAFLPGDIANEGTPAQYRLVRGALAPLAIPWFAVVGDHDVHEGTLEHVRRAMVPRLHHAFDVGPVRAVALNVFDGADPRQFCLGDEQLAWLDGELGQARRRQQTSAVFLHCYPTDLSAGGERLTELLREHDVRVVEMGHTHYNELANDGRTLFIATRSTGQVEEGPVGFSVTTLDGDAVSWRFFELGALPAVLITSPADERIERDDHPGLPRGRTPVRVRAKVWSDGEVTTVEAFSGDAPRTGLTRVGASAVWEGEIMVDAHAPSPVIVVEACDDRGRRSDDRIRLRLEDAARPARRAIDQDNAVGAWPERGILGTQLGPNKKGRAW
jgi:predicted phosphodiesterase